MKKILRTLGTVGLWIVTGIGTAALVMILLALQARSAGLPERQSLVLLIPDSGALTHPVTQAWLHAAQEEGIALTPMTDNEFIRASADAKAIPGILLPDTVHPQATDILISGLTQYVERGGKLWVSFDAALRTPTHNHYARAASRLSHLVGVRYALYARLQDKTLNESPVFASREAERVLGIQPGKLDFTDEGIDSWGELTTYGYPHLMYGHFRTEPLSAVQTFLRSSDGDPVLTLHAYGKGQVLFANLPLGYLKTRTDSYLLHRLLGFFNADLVGLPSLSAAPQAVGGIVLNLHVDSNAAQGPLAEMEKSGWFDHGPYSIHVTAGPDVTTAGDGLGLDLPHNPWMQAFLQRQYAKGHEIGNHGGWIHNLFGDHADAGNALTFEPYLELNHDSVSATIGAPATSYSAPMGNHPAWVTDWLKKKGFKGYYATSDNGLGPTRSFSNGQAPAPHGLWTFPITNFKRIATFDEMADEDTQQEEIAIFIDRLLTHASRKHVVRLFYFHPPALLKFPKSLKSIQTVGKRLEKTGQFRWYSMATLSDFMSRRETVQWETRLLPAAGARELSARSKTTLKDMSWLIPAGGVQKIRITHGQGMVSQSGNHWLVTAGDTSTLQVQWTPSP